MAGSGSGVDAVVVAVQSEQLPVRGAGIAEDNTLDSVSNLQDVDDAMLASTLPQEPVTHKSQIFIRACNRTITLNVNLRCDSVEEVKHQIEEREGIPFKEQYLIFGGKPLRQGTFLRDYDALGDQSTAHVASRVRGGHRTEEMTLKKFVEEVTPRRPHEEVPPRRALTRAAAIRGQQAPVTVTVLTELGHTILHGVLTCVLSAHRAGLVYDGACGMDNFRVYFHEGATEGLVVSRVYVDGAVVPAPPRDDERQKEDYLALQSVIEELFPLDTLHVGSIYKRLASLTSDIPKYPVRRTQLLQAHAAMVSSPVGVSTMCLNLMRFYDQLDKNSPGQQFIFRQAMEVAQRQTYKLHEAVKEQPLFKKVYEYIPPDNQNNSAGNAASLPNNQYEGNSTGLFHFARNWFTHAPAQRWDKGNDCFTGLPHLDYIFTYHFTNFMPEALLQLYKNFGDHNLLTEVLVPLAGRVSTQSR
ncbi:hypothetical protein ACP70R_020777 [Stipagrostis hirtigluma subsp. patula]